ncbi:MAG: cytochrome-c peroxidase, partial [Proteobacteria bacterium]|nr:cytochrome-c peroxidase [Pseudomonadota bacterium]
VLRNDFIGNGANPQDPIKGMLEAAGHKGGVDVMATGKGHDNCIAARASLQTLGVNRFADCAEGASTAELKSARPAQPVAAPAYTAEQKGRMTYLAVCTGCHTFNSRLIGPPMVTVKALYGKNAKALADWIAKPTHKRQDYPEMPPQNYLPADLRLAVAQYILNELSN